MSSPELFSAVPCGLASALTERGFSALTEIQEAVLNPALAGVDLRLSSNTGSGKTVAVGFLMAEALDPNAARQSRNAHPQALVIAPTRELAQQIERELTWLYRPLKLRLAVVTGGTNIGGDFQAFARGPHVVVGTPGRLVDHVRRGSLDLSGAAAVVLDEADEMLDMGFRDDLEFLLDATPTGRRTHLVSATFPYSVLRLADRVQTNAIMVQGTKVGAPNRDISHVGYTVHDRDRTSALVNVLLSSLGRRTLVFTRTRATTHGLATQLAHKGFSAAGLSGEMGQRERTSTLEAFRSGTVTTLVATDVAARGLDIDDVAQVVHFDLPTNDEVFTHRSGRTGRAGNKGTSIVMVPPQRRQRVEAVFRRLKLEADWRNVPTPAEVNERADAHLAATISDGPKASPGDQALAHKLIEGADDPVSVVAALLGRVGHRGPCSPCHVTDASPPQGIGKRDRVASRNHGRQGPQDFTPFVINWGAQSGASPQRLLAMVCRRGDIRSQFIGAIRITGHSSTVDVATDQAPAFARAIERPDSRNPLVRIRPWRDAKPEPRKHAPRSTPNLGPRKGKPAPSSENAPSAANAPSAENAPSSENAPSAENALHAFAKFQATPNKAPRKAKSKTKPRKATSKKKFAGQSTTKRKGGGHSPLRRKKTGYPKSGK